MTLAPPGSTSPPATTPIQRRTAIDSGDFENALMRIINLLADWEEHPPWSNKPMPVQVPSIATTLDELRSDFNLLLVNLHTAGVITSEEAPPLDGS